MTGLRMIWESMIYAAVMLLIIIVVWEWLRNRMFMEGFTDGVVPEFFGKFFPRRYDIVPGQLQEEDGWLRNTKYFEGYVDLQQLGYKGDFCRVVEKENNPESRIMACALAGQEGLDSLTYRTESQRAGMRFSRDDYFRDVNKDGRDDYGRILKMSPAPNDKWQAMVVLAGYSRFKQTEEVQDNSPPANIADLLWFYEGIMVWYRFIDDMLDYAENTQIQIAGSAKVNEEEKLTIVEGLRFNMIDSADSTVQSSMDQFLKIGENAKLEYDTIVELRQLRAISVWVYFHEFTSNARIFDFGNGAGHDNVLLGIEGKGNTISAFGKLGKRPTEENLVCQGKAAEELSPQVYMLTSEANVNNFDCKTAAPIPSMYPENEDEGEVDPRANLLFEIWDSQQRKMRIRVVNAIPLKKWTHIAITTTDGSSFRPTWQVYIDGKNVYEQADGHMPLKSYTTMNYIGKSNWESETAQYQDADQRLRGALFDFRLYRLPMSASKIERTVQWGKKKLGDGKKLK